MSERTYTDAEIEAATERHFMDDTDTPKKSTNVQAPDTGTGLNSHNSLRWVYG